MKSHRSNAKPSGELANVLRRSKHILPDAARTDVRPAESVASLIAAGTITRERCCDGKKRYRTWEFADQTIRPFLERKYNKIFETYPCCFCNGFHLATVEELVA